MIDPSPWSDGGCAALCPLFVNVAAKSTFILLGALCVDFLLARRVLARSSVWHATLVAAAVLPLATLLLPPLSVLPIVYKPADDGYVAMTPIDTVDMAIAPDGLDSAAVSKTDRQETDWWAMAACGCITIYLFGCAVLAVRFAISLRAVAELTARAELAEPQWREELHDWCQRLHIARPVHLLVSEEIAIPVQVGWWRASIVLPRGLMTSEDRLTRDAVLVHELGHVRRGDFGWNLLLRALSILYWPHPLIWLAARRISQIREQACDELCIHWLGGRALYQERLIELAADLLSRRPIASLGIAIAQRTKLARRLKWMETSSGRAECLQSRLARRSLVVSFSLLSVVLGAASVAPASHDEQDVQRERAPADAPKTPPAVAPAEANAATDEAESGEQTEAGPLRVRVERVKRHDLQIEAVQPCVLAAERTFRVDARVPGVVRRLWVDLGDHVQKGDVLAELESRTLAPELTQAESLLAESKAEEQRAAAILREAQATLEAARAAADEAETDVEAAQVKLKFQMKRQQQAQKQVDDGTVDGTGEEHLIDAQSAVTAAKSSVASAKSSVESAKSAVRRRAATVASAQANSKVAQARVRIAEARLDEAKLRSEAVRVVSPSDGVVIERFANVGDVVSAPDKDFPVCTIADLRRMTAVTHLPERDGLRVKRGDSARIFVNALPRKAFDATVMQVAYNIEPATRTLRVEMEIDENSAGGRLLPGLPGIAAVALAMHRDALSLSRRACHGSTVYTIVDGRAVATRIKTGAGSFDRVEVLSGLAEGDLVISGLANPKAKQPNWAKQPLVEIVD